MNFNKHLNLKDTHAFLSPSNNAWLNYDEAKLQRVYLNKQQIYRGTLLHAFAEQCINLGQPLPDAPNITLNSYVNDAIAYGLQPEVVLYYSDNCYGTSDGISFENNVLRIHDLKTGSTPAHIEQLYVYAALFCLEYGVDPTNIEIICRIYQSGKIKESSPDSETIQQIMQKIIVFDEIINQNKEAAKW